MRIRTLFAEAHTNTQEKKKADLERTPAHVSVLSPAQKSLYGERYGFNDKLLYARSASRWCVLLLYNSPPRKEKRKKRNSARQQAQQEGVPGQHVRPCDVCSPSLLKREIRVEGVYKHTEKYVLQKKKKRKII